MFQKRVNPEKYQVCIKGRVFKIKSLKANYKTGAEQTRTYNKNLQKLELGSGDNEE